MNDELTDRLMREAANKLRHDVPEGDVSDWICLEMFRGGLTVREGFEYVELVLAGAKLLAQEDIV